MESATDEKSTTLQMTSIEGKKRVKGNEDFNDEEQMTNKFLLPSGKNEQLDDTEDIDFIFDHIVGNGKWTDFGQWILFTAIILIAYCILNYWYHIYNFHSLCGTRDGARAVDQFRGRDELCRSSAQRTFLWDNRPTRPFCLCG